MQATSHNAPLRQETALPPAHSVADASPKLPHRLLVAEDARCIQQNFRAIFAKMHVKAEMVEDGQMACDRVEQSKAEGRPYDFILMDIQMPRMNGYKAVEHLRKQGWRGPIVAVSALADEKGHEKVLQAGFNDCIPKPVNEARLRDVFTRYLSTEHTPASAQPTGQPHGAANGTSSPPRSV